MERRAKIDSADEIYAAIVTAAATIPQTRQQDFALRLVLLLANQIGNRDILLDCIQEAAQSYSNE